jgi:hypothetical protein
MKVLGLIFWLFALFVCSAGTTPPPPPTSTSTCFIDALCAMESSAFYIASLMETVIFVRVPQLNVIIDADTVYVPQIVSVCISVETVTDILCEQYDIGAVADTTSNTQHHTLFTIRQELSGVKKISVMVMELSPRNSESESSPAKHIYESVLYLTRLETPPELPYFIPVVNPPYGHIATKLFKLELSTNSTAYDTVSINVEGVLSRYVYIDFNDMLLGCCFSIALQFSAVAL